jgi:mannose-6-phosphate isomerase-like protein (cupin superfamily)
MGRIVNIYDFPLVENVCNQKLREVLKTQEFSMAHVGMAPHDSSLLHRHHGFEEVYFILSGAGELIHGSTQTKISPGACVEIPLKAQHTLTNGDLPLTHFVFAVPPFDPGDVELLSRQEEITQQRTFKLPDTFVGLDGGRVYEFRDINWKSIGISVAYGYLEGLQRARLHHHDRTTEWYYIAEGNGKVLLDNTKLQVRQGDLITVPVGAKHALENVLKEPLRVVAICNPPFDPDDFVHDE